MTFHALGQAACLVFLVCPGFGQSMITVTTSPIGGTADSAGDVNGDGIGDLLVKSGGYFVFDGATGASFGFLVRAGGAGTYPRYVGVGDVDGDGRDDLAYGNYGSFAVVSGGDGSTLLTLTGGGVDVFGGGDFDGDGLSDLMLIQNNEVRVRSTRTGALRFQMPFFPLGVGPIYTDFVALGDQNGDGLVDAIASYYYYSNPSSVGLVVRGPNGVTSSGPVFPWPAGDVNGDGKADILSVPSGPFVTDKPYVVGVGFGWTPAVADGGAPSRPVGDVDGDGFADIAVTAGGVPLLLSGASHAALPSVPMVSLPRRLGDLDGDGRTECQMGQYRFEWSDPSVPVASRMLRRGTPGTTSDGRRPYLATRGHAGLGRTAYFDMRGGMPNGTTFLAYGSLASADLTALGAPGNHSYTSLLGAFVFAANGNGVAQYAATIPVAPSLLGTTISLQAAVFDAAANPLGLVTSNAIDVTTNN